MNEKRNGKGDKPRPFSVSLNDFGKSWDSTFKKMSSVTIKNKRYKVEPEVKAEIKILRAKLDEISKDRKRLYDLTLDLDDARDTSIIMQALAHLSRHGQEELAKSAAEALDRYKTRNFIIRRDQK